MEDIKILDFYTETEEPLRTNESVRFFFKYTNTGDEAVEAVSAEIFMGQVSKPVKLPGVEPKQTKTVEMLLTNNISEEIESVGIRIDAAPEKEIFKSFSWLGRIELGIEDFKRYDVKDTANDTYYRVFIHNHGTRRAQNVKVTIEKDNAHYGEIVIEELAPKSATPINLGFDSRLGGLYKIGISACNLRGKRTSVNRSFHIELEKRRGA